MTGVAGRTVAVLPTDSVEQVELTGPVRALKEANAKVVVVAQHAGQIQDMNHHDKGEKLKVDQDLASASPDRFGALVLPGGVANPDALRIDPKAVEFVCHFVQAKKSIAAICHAPWTMIEADGVRGRTMTSWPSLRTDLRNAGAKWVDRSVVRDGIQVTSRKPDDLPDFCREMLDLFGTAKQRQAA